MQSVIPINSDRSERIDIPVQVDALRISVRKVSHSPLVAKEIVTIVERDVSKLVKPDGVYSSVGKKQGFMWRTLVSIPRAFS